MQIKVGCGCGQSYEFEVEPVNGAMPCTVVCPACGVDGTAASNQFIAQQAAAAAPTPAPAMESATPGRLRVNRPAPPVAPAATAPAEAAAEPAAAPSPVQKRYTRALEPDREPPKVEARVAMGVLGGVVAAIVIMLGWYYLAVAIDKPIVFFSSITGVLVGIAVRIMAKEGTPMLGYAAAMCAALAILGGRFMIVNHFNPVRDIAQALESVVAEQTESAKQGLKAKTDDEVKAWLVKYGELEHPPTADDIKEFRQTTVPMLQSMLDNMKTTSEKLGKLGINQGESFGDKFNLLKNSMGVDSVIFLLIGVAAAWRIGSGHD